MGSHRVFDTWVKVYQCAKDHAGLTVCTIASVLPLTITNVAGNNSSRCTASM